MRSLFGRLLSSYLIIILLTAVTVGFSLSRFFTNYYRMVLGEELTQQAEQLASRLATPLELDGAVDLEYMMDSFEDCIGAGVWLVDSVGVVQETSELYAGWRGARIEGPLQRELAAGRTVVYRSGDGPLSAGIITVAVPIRKSDGVDGGGFAPLSHAGHIKDHAGGQALVLPDVDVGSAPVHRGRILYVPQDR